VDGWDCNGRLEIPIAKGELIHVEFSYKYSEREMEELADGSGLAPVCWFVDLAFRVAVTGSSVTYSMCPAAQVTHWSDSKLLYNLYLLHRAPFHFPRLCLDTLATSVPSAEEFVELWRAWDTVTTKMITADMALEKPIDLRHPFVFYMGHM